MDNNKGTHWHACTAKYKAIGGYGMANWRNLAKYVWNQSVCQCSSNAALFIVLSGQTGCLGIFLCRQWHMSLKIYVTHSVLLL